jgi:gamma-glutamyltranspeptidase/glutathione hydrolase
MQRLNQPTARLVLRRSLIILLLSLVAHQAIASEYAVATANPLATEAGMRILAMGGSAADAAVAIQAVLGVVEPQSSGLGGGSIALYRDAQSERMIAFDGLAKSPAAYDPLSPKAAGYTHSGAAVGVPGTLRMLAAIHRLHGKLPWSPLFHPAIELADQGFPVPPYLARSLAAAARIGMAVPEWLTDGSGKPVSQGSIVRNQALAATLRAVAQDGANALYVRLAEQIVATMQRAAPAGRMTADDLAAYQPIERQPLCLKLHQHVLCSFPPPSYGGVTVLEMLGILATRQQPKDAFLNSEFVHRLIEAGRLAEADRMAVVGDVDNGAEQARELLSPAHLQARAVLIMDQSVINDAQISTPHPGCARSERAPEPSTSQIAIVDATGDALAMTTTININFGAWLTVGGFFLNDAMTNFAEVSAIPCSANAPAGDKRPETAMAPVIATNARGSLVLTGGSAGAGEIVDYVAQAVLELLDGRMPLEALDEGHVSTARAPYPESAGMVELEQGRAIAQLAPRLAALGHRIRIAPLQSGTAFIVRGNGHWEGAVDPRRDGSYASSR